jgi:hypothetical protein
MAFLIPYAHSVPAHLILLGLQICIYSCHFFLGGGKFEGAAKEHVCDASYYVLSERCHCREAFGVTMGAWVTSHVIKEITQNIALRCINLRIDDFYCK